jgi:16S rRNA (cytidine1402-2'-O)-methyltransferase
MTLVIGKPLPMPLDERPVPEAVEAYVARGLSRMDAMKAVARDRGVSKREIYGKMENDDRT